MVWMDDGGKRRRRKKVKAAKMTKLDRYIETRPSTNFKNWLRSKPMEKHLSYWYSERRGSGTGKVEAVRSHKLIQKTITDYFRGEW
jgi:hypothetical protein